MRYRSCPYCGAPVPEKRKTCPGCGCWMDDDAAAAPSNKPLLIALAAIVTALIVVTFLAFSGKLNRDEPDPYADAAAVATEPVGADDPGGPQTTAEPAATLTPTSTPAPTTTPAPAATPTPAIAAYGTYILPDSAGRYLSESELEGLTDRDLALARNEIFARHGYLFTTPWIAGYFETQSWYNGTTPAAQFDSEVLNDFERANIELIVRVEAERAGG